jgi:dihydrofolate synthase / folylpolyglutamate synthase
MTVTITHTNMTPVETVQDLELSGVLQELYARGSRGIRLGLDAMREACARAGNPERAFACVHIAGTNGKGSTCAMVESVARAAGKHTGLYTSPHLCRFAERIRIGGLAISDAALVRVLRQALDVGPELTFFEVATLAAFLAFREAGVEFAVLEVGLGGRLDATNVVQAPLATAITSIALDHQNLLGDTIAAIAREKAGIAKTGVPMVLGELCHDARLVIEAHATSVGAVISSGKAQQDSELGDSFSSTSYGGSAFALSEASYQWSNAAVARKLAHLAGFTSEQCEKGFQTVSWPGRYEWIESAEGPTLLDAAHNPEGSRALLKALEYDAPRDHADQAGLAPGLHGAYEARRRLIHSCNTLVYGALADKAWSESLSILAPRFANRVYTEPKGRPAADPKAMHAMFAGFSEVDVSSALRTARTYAKSGLVLVCGSIYLVGACRAHLLGLPMDPPIAL